MTSIFKPFVVGCCIVGPMTHLCCNNACSMYCCIVGPMTHSCCNNPCSMYCCIVAPFILNCTPSHYGNVPTQLTVVACGSKNGSCKFLSMIGFIGSPFIHYPLPMLSLPLRDKPLVTVYMQRQVPFLVLFF